MPLPATKPNIYLDLTAAHCRMARAALRWNLAELAAEARVSDDVICRFEMGMAEPRPANRMAIFVALECGGVEFVKNDCGRIAVFIRDQVRKSANAL